MNLYFFEMILKFLRMFFIAIISIFNINYYTENIDSTQNDLINKDTYAVNNVILKQEPKITNDNKKVVSTTTNNVNKQTTTINQNVNSVKSQTVITENIEKSNVTKNTEQIVDVNKANSIEEFTGKLTGYGPDCAGCSGYGGLACKTREKESFSLKNDGIYYTDTEYGKVRILAAATSKFKCGTIITITKSGQTPVTAVVLDTGSSMRKAWANGEVWMDLAYESEASAGNDNLLGKNIKFSVQRYGW